MSETESVKMSTSHMAERDRRLPAKLTENFMV